MKKWFILISLGLSLICTWLIKENNEIVTIQEEVAEEVLRFHVRANSDSKEDQKIKMQVKEAVMAYMKPLFENTQNLEEARLLVENHFSEMKNVIHEKLNSLGCSYGFQIEMRREEFPRKTYGDCTFPEGIYEAVIISLGQGKGQNWWCMIYPQLCFLDETYGFISEEKKGEMETILTEEAYDWITDPVNIRIKFRINWLNDLFGIEQ